jgi:hypothetical protein
MRHGVWGIVVGIALPGCSTTCSWFGRNSDCSNNCWGKKPNPVQQGPLAGTYTQPNNANMTGTPVNGQATNGQPMMQGQANGQYPQTPVITTTPAGAAPGMNNMPASPLNTPAQFPANGGAAGTPTSLQQLPPAEFNPKPRPVLTNSMETANGPVVPQPEVKGPPILDLNVPSASTAKKMDAGDATKPSPFPMVMAPQGADRSVRVVDVPNSPPNVQGPPTLTAPTVAGPETMPRDTKMPAPATPPPLPQAPPPPPMLN